MTATKGELRGGADISHCGSYRYTLWRRWDDGRVACFVMLNPSTADASVDDPTVRKCVGFARRWGGGGIRIANLFAFRTPHPRELAERQADGVDIVGPGNDALLASHLDTSHAVVVAWGSAASAGATVKSLIRERAAWIHDLAQHAEVPLCCLGTARDGSPRHPLMLPYSCELRKWGGP